MVYRCQESKNRWDPNTEEAQRPLDFGHQSKGEGEEVLPSERLRPVVGFSSVKEETHHPLREGIVGG